MVKLSMNRPSGGKNTTPDIQENLDRQRKILASGGEEAKVRISVDVPRSTHERLRMYAWSRRTSMNKIINQAIVDLLKEE